MAGEAMQSPIQNSADMVLVELHASRVAPEARKVVLVAPLGILHPQVLLDH